MEKTEVKYIIVNYHLDKAVQNWTFAGKKHIIYCESAEWALKFDRVDAAKDTRDYLKKNFPGQDLTVVKATFYTDVTFERVK